MHSAEQGDCEETGRRVKVEIAMNFVASTAREFEIDRAKLGRSGAAPLPPRSETAT